MNPFWRAYFSTGLVQPPTSNPKDPYPSLEQFWWSQSHPHNRIVGLNPFLRTLRVKASSRIFPVSWVFFCKKKRLPTWQLSESAWSEHIWTIIRNPWTLPLGNVCQVAYLHSLKLTNVEGNMSHPKRKGSYSNPSIFRCKLAVNFRDCAFQKRTSLFFSQGTWPVSRPTILRKDPFLKNVFVCGQRSPGFPWSNPMTWG